MKTCKTYKTLAGMDKGMYSGLILTDLQEVFRHTRPQNSRGVDIFWLQNISN